MLQIFLSRSLIIGFIIVVACQQPEKVIVDETHEVEAIKKLIAADYIDAVNAQDTSAYANLFTDNDGYRQIFRYPQIKWK